MLIESARIVAIDQDSVWVETINRTSCGTCVAEAGCGQSLLQKWFAKQSYLKVSLAGREPNTLQVNDRVEIGIPEQVVVQSALLLYLLPLISFLVAGAVAQTLGASEFWVALAAMAGLLLSGWFVYVRTLYASHRHSQPVLLDLIAKAS